MAWEWFSTQGEHSFFFCRLTQLGLMRLLATSAVMGDEVQTIGQAWKVYDRWLEDSRIGIRHESFEFDRAFRDVTRSVSRLASPKALGDCWLQAFSQAAGATLVTFDKGLATACRKAGQPFALLRTAPVGG